MQIGTKMGQHQMGFLAHFLGNQANAYCVKWVLDPALEQGGRVWADWGPVEQLRKKVLMPEWKNRVSKQSGWTAKQAYTI